MSKAEPNLILLSEEGTKARNLALIGSGLFLLMAFLSTFIDANSRRAEEFSNVVMMTGLAAAAFGTVAWNASRIAGIGLSVFFMVMLVSAITEPPPNSVEPYDMLYVLALVAGFVWALFVTQLTFRYHQFLKLTGRSPLGSGYIRDSGNTIIVIVSVLMVIGFGSSLLDSSHRTFASRDGPGGSTQAPPLIIPDLIQELKKEGVLAPSANVIEYSFQRTSATNRQGALVTAKELLAWWTSYDVETATSIQLFGRMELGTICDFGDDTVINVGQPGKTATGTTEIRTLKGLGEDQMLKISRPPYSTQANIFLSTLRKLNAEAMTPEAKVQCILEHGSDFDRELMRRVQELQ